MHLIAALCLLKPWWQCRRSHGLSQEEEETTNLPQTLEVKPRILSKSETYSILHWDEHLDPLMDLEAPEGQEDQENHQYPSLILFPSNQLEN
jgi:hypothetical protein